MVTPQQVCWVALTQRGKRYVFGAEARCSDPSPPRFDCSELVEWTMCQLGVPMVDGSANQLSFCKARGTVTTVGKAIATPGALLFRVVPSGNNHVAFSLGNGSTMEAMGSRWPVGVYNAHGRPWTHGALIPGVNYGAAPVARPPAAGPNPNLVKLAQGISFCKNGVFRQGDRNDCVKFIQAGIAHLDPGRGITVDGDFGPKTTKAVMDMQRFFKLQPDGVVGPMTWRILFP